MYRYHTPVRHAQHTVRACACARHTHAPRPRCAPRKGSARRSLRRTAEVEQRDARPDESRSAGHARCAAPDRPVVQPPPSIRACVGLLARLRTHFLAVTGSAMQPAQKPQCQPHAAAAVRRPDPLCPRLCDLLQARTAARAHWRALHAVSGKASASRSPRRTLNRRRRPARAKLSSPLPTRQWWSPRPKHPCAHIFGNTRPHRPSDTHGCSARYSYARARIVARVAALGCVPRACHGAHARNTRRLGFFRRRVMCGLLRRFVRRKAPGGHGVACASRALVCLVACIRVCGP